MLELTDKNFEEETKKNKIVVVDFWAEWCGPCRMFAGIFEEFSKENPDVVCAKVNVDYSPMTSSKYNIMSIPTIMIFKNGEYVSQKSGILPKQLLKDFVNSVK